MPDYLTISQFTLIWPFVGIAILIPLVLSPFYYLMLLKLRNKGKEIDIRAMLITSIIVCSALCILGLVSGFISGNSRESILDSVVPAILSLVGALVIYLVNRDKNSESALDIKVSIMLICLSLGLLIGTIWGAETREKNLNSAFALNRNAKIVEYCLRLQKKLKTRLGGSEKVDLKCSDFPKK